MKETIFLYDTKNDKFYELDKIGLCVEDGMKYSDNDMDFYKLILSMYGSQYEKKRMDIERRYKDARENNKFDAFIVLTHSLKGESRGIGAGELGELFYELEKAGKAKDIEKIDLYYDKTINMWKELCESINSFSIQ